ncbi:MAG: DNA cytosine methyltransferase [Acholeplasmatales bacterium]|nr:DNA cytosine methyltransferase [Acholeplasmatales bacterium]
MSIITIAEAAELAGKSQKTIRRAVAAKKLKSTKIQNKTRIEKDDFDEWMKNGCCGTEEQDNNSYKKDEVNWIDISDSWKIDGWNKKKDRSEYNFIDLFSGAGGLSCGLVMAGLNPVASVEIMPEAVATYERNFIKAKGFDEKVETRDIREQCVKENLYKAVEGKHIDVIAGGFPCQGFSMSGYRVVDDPRNSLYKEMKSIVEHLRPDFVVMENVEGLRSMLNGKVEEKIIEDYKDIGYNINITVLNSADYYTPQTRHRVIFIGNRIGVTNYHPKPLLDEKHYRTVGQAIGKYMDCPEDKSINHIFAKTSPTMQERLKAVPVGKSLYSNYSDAWKKVDWNKPSCTVKENHGGVNIHPILSRPMTPRELATLQSFPDDFIFEGSKKWQLVQIGNAVPCFLGKAIGLSLRKMMDNYHNSPKLCKNVI